jgi:hypothetical protein
MYKENIHKTSHTATGDLVNFIRGIYGRLILCYLTASFYGDE